MASTTRALTSRATAAEGVPEARFSSWLLEPAARQLGLWSAIATAVTWMTFFLTSSFVIGSRFPIPWDQDVTIGASILIAPAFVLLMVSVHQATPEKKRVWTQAAIAFSVLYAAFVSLVYITILFVIEPHVVHGTQSEVAPLLFGHGTFTQMVDGLGYTYMSLAIWLTAPVFAGSGLMKWIRRVAIASGPGALGVLVSYVVYTGPLTILGIGAFLVPAYAVLLAITFNRARARTEAHA